MDPVSIVLRGVWSLVSAIFMVLWVIIRALFFMHKRQQATKADKAKLTFESRYEHTHIVAGSGHGKTQLLQSMILQNDLPHVVTGNVSVLVIDSQGDLINNILRLKLMSKLSDRLLLIDPNDIQHPPALNLFDFGLSAKTNLSPLEREKLLNNAVSLYMYLFGALLDTELTARQSMLFTYLARLMLVVPNANIYTLIEFVEHPETTQAYLKDLDPLQRRFFESQFPSSMYDGTRMQILSRLYTVMSNSVLERMFSHERNMVNIGEAMNKGSLILINTAKSLLKQDGCELVGRFFIALLQQATIERDIIPREKRLPTFVYIDEAQDYFANDENIKLLIEQSRKFNVGLHFAHQTLGELRPGLLQTITANTAIKFVGGLSAEDTRFFAAEMQVEPEVFVEAKKSPKETRFIFKYRDQARPTVMHVPLGEMEKQPKLTQAEYEKLLAANRKRISLPPASPRPPAVEKRPMPPLQPDMV